MRSHLMLLVQLVLFESEVTALRSG